MQARAASQKTLLSKSPKQDLRVSASHSHRDGRKSLQLLTTQPDSCLTRPLSGYSLLSLGGQVLQRCPRCTLSGWDTCQASWDCSSFPLHHSACAHNQLGREKWHWGKSHMATLQCPTWSSLPTETLCRAEIWKASVTKQDLLVLLHSSAGVVLYLF